MKNHHKKLRPVNTLANIFAAKNQTCVPKPEGSEGVSLQKRGRSTPDTRNSKRRGPEGRVVWVGSGTSKEPTVLQASPCEAFLGELTQKCTHPGNRKSEILFHLHHHQQILIIKSLSAIQFKTQLYIRIKRPK